MMEDAETVENSNYQMGIEAYRNEFHSLSISQLKEVENHLQENHEIPFYLALNFMYLNLPNNVIAISGFEEILTSNKNFKSEEIK